MNILPQEIIRAKRDGHELSRAQIKAMVRGITDETVTDGQVAAFGMAVFFRGMTMDERICLTRAMMESGTVLDWKRMGLPSGVVDKHSTGGVGDKVSLLLAPLAAACGAYVPMISGRGLGHTGGTLDKFDSIPGYDTAPDLDTFSRVTREVGCAVIGQTADLAPADRRFYAVRDVTATVESIDLITASILSKKLAAGLQGLVMDVKFGSGAFMEQFEDARELAESIAHVATGAGVPTVALLTDMNQVLGSSVGNSLEVMEAVKFLTNERAEPRLAEVTRALTAEMLVLARIAQDTRDGGKRVDKALSSGRAAEVFGRMVAGLGGPADFMERWHDHLTVAPVTLPVYPKQPGFVASMVNRDVGLALVNMGGGRTRPDQEIDHSVGLSRFAHVGDAVGPDAPLCLIHAQDSAQAEQAAQAVLTAVTVTDDRPAESGPVVRERIAGESVHERRAGQNDG
ncbi:thymidine phosphorylase [Pseudodesulfovibrio senegalensis]|uniref:thymidine phosphorylase n=1 Tax=Pseudodesulfovibrio senegalensis TaxID=1721087 RepID=A0A6N6MYL1_9BACT|nr:thymidine phosphorylase [Pseudodesulfovibrio senegalensis]KAB1439118.1 thymidine phosphorylase [Pseudodesulfovibrio senegalensis]